MWNSLFGKSRISQCKSSSQNGAWLWNGSQTIRPNCNWFHLSTAIGWTISGLIIDMHTGQTIWAVISVIASRSIRNHLTSTFSALEDLMAWVGFIVPFLKSSLFVFTVHVQALLLVFPHRRVCSFWWFFEYFFQQDSIFRITTWCYCRLSNPNKWAHFALASIPLFHSMNPKHCALSYHIITKA